MALARKKIFVLLGLILFSICSVLDPIYGLDMWLQHIGTLLIFLLMILDIRKGWMSWKGFLGLGIFTLLHAFGARWLYTMVPYDQWMLDSINWSPNDYFGWTRNHYDRMVHLCFGLCLIIASKDYIQKKWQFNSKQSWLVAWLAIQFFSMFYELFEWWLTFMLAEDQVESYNGQQGDMWDPHKDMALAMLGSSVIYISWSIKLRLKKSN